VRYVNKKSYGTDRPLQKEIPTSNMQNKKIITCENIDKTFAESGAAIEKE